MYLPDLPGLTITEILDEHCHAEYQPSRFIGENWIACLYVGNEKLVRGKITDVNTSLSICIFRPTTPADIKLLEKGGSYPNLAWLGVTAELVLDPVRRWQKTRFEPTDAIRFRTTSGSAIMGPVPADFRGLALDPGIVAEGGELVKGGWDHEHCEICSQTIGTSREPEGYQSDPHTWVCTSCFNKYVEPKSLAFIRP